MVNRHLAETSDHPHLGKTPSFNTWLGFPANANPRRQQWVYLLNFGHPRRISWLHSCHPALALVQSQSLQVFENESFASSQMNIWIRKLKQKYVLQKFLSYWFHSLSKYWKNEICKIYLNIKIAIMCHYMQSIVPEPRSFYRHYESCLLKPIIFQRLNILL